jgi:hypothetical protein
MLNNTAGGLSMDNEDRKNEQSAWQASHQKQSYNDIKDDSPENQNKGHNIKKQALGPNTYRKR